MMTLNPLMALAEKLPTTKRDQDETPAGFDSLLEKQQQAQLPAEADRPLTPPVTTREADDDARATASVNLLLPADWNMPQNRINTPAAEPHPSADRIAAALVVAQAVSIEVQEQPAAASLPADGLRLPLESESADFAFSAQRPAQFAEVNRAIALQSAGEPAYRSTTTAAASLAVPPELVPAASAGNVVEAFSPIPQSGAAMPLTPVSHVTPATLTAQPLLQESLGSAGWQQSLGQHLTFFSRQGLQHAELRLHPEELGALQITMRVVNDQAQMHVVAETPQVRSALEAAMPHLRAALAENGIQLGQSSVDNGNASADSQHQSAAGHSDVRQQQDEDNSETVITGTLTLGGVNTFV